jgi:hypothetical protein
MRRAKSDSTPRNYDRLLDRYIPWEQRWGVGRGLRERVPREKHAGWAARKDRPDPIDLLIKSNATRLPNLIPIRYGRMLTSAFAFLRGSAAVMASDLSRTPKTGIWVQACGDCHLMNFGAFATPERQFIFDINDFDETLPAPWEWDLKRLAASFAVAGKYINLSRRDASAASESAVRSYRKSMGKYSRMRVLDIWYDRENVEQLIEGLPDPVFHPTLMYLLHHQIGLGHERERPVGAQTRRPLAIVVIGGAISITLLTRARRELRKVVLDHAARTLLGYALAPALLPFMRTSECSCQCPSDLYLALSTVIMTGRKAPIGTHHDRIEGGMVLFLRSTARGCIQLRSRPG